MKQKIQSVWLAAMLSLVLCCNEAPKPANTEVITEQNQSKEATSSNNTNHKTKLTTDIYTQAANETCDCIQPMVEKAKRLKELEINKQRTDMKKVALEMAKMQPQIEKCSDEIRKKYSKINNALDEKRMLNALLTECPDMATLFSNLGK